ncbi:MAG: hypothetical protein EXS38_08600 [Opitutus sp.]|nr:hypothetical protein [Opitutus sp.]
MQARNDAVHFGYVFVDCRLTGAPGLTRYVLVRIEPGRFPDSHVAFIHCPIGDFLSPTGWLLNKVAGAETIAPSGRVRFWEFRSTDLAGQPLDVSQRISASRQLTPAEAARMRDVLEVLGGADQWRPR